MADTPSREALVANRLAQEIDRFKRNLEMYATDPADPSHKLSFHMTAEDAEAVLARLAAKPSDEGVREACDAETVQTLLDLLNPLHGELDRQTYDAKVAMDFDMPPDYAHDDISITAQMERDLTQAVSILESRKRSAPGEQKP